MFWLWTVTFAIWITSDLSGFTDIEWMQQSDQVSGVVYTDTITVLLRKAVGTFGVLSL